MSTSRTEGKGFLEPRSESGPKTLSDQLVSLIDKNANKIDDTDYGMVIFSVKGGIVYRIDVSESIIVPNENGTNSRARLPKVVDSIAPRSS